MCAQGEFTFPQVKNLTPGSNPQWSRLQIGGIFLGFHVAGNSQLLEFGAWIGGSGIGTPPIAGDGNPTAQPNFALGHFHLWSYVAVSTHGPVLKFA